MNFPTDEQRILNLLSRGYKIPTRIFEKEALDNVLKAKFMVEEKPVRIIKEYAIQYEDILSATVDSRFNLKNIESIIY